MTTVRMSRVHNCTASESVPNGSERWKVSEQTSEAVIQLGFWEPVSLGAVQATLSGSLETLPTLYEMFVMTGPVSLGIVTTTVTLVAPTPPMVVALAVVPVAEPDQIIFPVGFKPWKESV